MAEGDLQVCGREARFLFLKDSPRRLLGLDEEIEGYHCSRRSRRTADDHKENPPRK